MDRPGAATATALAGLVVLAGCLGGVLPRSGPDAGTPTPGPGTAVEVVSVVDGDTVTVEYPNGSRETVRLLGVDAPETRSGVDPTEFEGVPDDGAGRSCLREWADRAAEFAVDRLAGRRVRIATDPASPNRGFYGRLLAYVYVDGESFNRRLLAGGYARVYESDFTRLAEYRTAEAAARRNATGLWACASSPRTTRPGTTRTATARTGTSEVGVHVDAVNYDAAGNDNRNPNGEYVVVRNAGSDPVDLGGWTLRDEAGHRYEFPEGFVLGPGERVTVHTGAGENTATDRYWGRGSAVWNNDGDTVVLADAAGRVVDRESW